MFSIYSFFVENILFINNSLIYAFSILSTANFPSYQFKSMSIQNNIFDGLFYLFLYFKTKINII